MIQQRMRIKKKQQQQQQKQQTMMKCSVGISHAPLIINTINIYT